MSDSRDRGKAQEGLRALRRNEGNVPAAPSGYQNTEGRTVAQSGNDKAPYVWPAPFAEPLSLAGPVDLALEHSLPQGNRLQVTWGTCFPAIDVADYRVATIVLDAQIPFTAPDTILQLMPVVSYPFFDPSFERENLLGLTWTPLGFVNPDPAAEETLVHYQGLTSQNTVLTTRTLGTLALNLPVRAVVNNGTRFRMALDFEVASHAMFTLSTRVVNGAVEDIQSLQYYYTRRV